MTIVCFDGKELVSDSQMTIGDSIALAPFRKIYVPEGDEYWDLRGVKIVAFGIAGDAMAIEYIREKLQQGIDHKTRFDENKDLGFHAILVNENGEAFVWRYIKSSERNRERVELLPMLPPIAIGSGSDFAYGAMAIGKGARIGVKAACRLDPHCSGSIQHFVFEGRPAVPSQRPPKAEPAAEKITEVPGSKPIPEESNRPEKPVDVVPAKVA